MAKAYHCSRSSRLNCALFRPLEVHSMPPTSHSCRSASNHCRGCRGLIFAFWRSSPRPGWLRSALAGYNRILSCGSRAAFDFDLWSRCK